MIIENIYVTHAQATLAAIEYVCDKFGQYSWFNGRLRKAMSELHIKPNAITFRAPLIIYTHWDQQRILYEYEGYHYLIEEMEKYYKHFELVDHFPINLLKYSIVFFLVLLLLFTLIPHYSYLFSSVMGGKSQCPNNTEGV